VEDVSRVVIAELHLRIHDKKAGGRGQLKSDVGVHCHGKTYAKAIIVARLKKF
jgi:hypothetical protein